MKLSILLSIHNRLELFSRGLWSLSQQAFDPKEFEVLVLDDMSTVDLRPLLLEYRGKLQIRHVKIDHTRHRIWKELNPNWQAGRDEAFANWWHTPALSTNIGIKRAHGEVLLFSQPEIIQHPDNLRIGYEEAHDGRAYVFGQYWLSSREFVDWCRAQGDDWRSHYWQGLLAAPGAQKETHWGGSYYWYIGFLKRERALAIGGVDEEYLRGVTGEDDNFKWRVQECGVQLADLPRAQGLHQDHFDEGGHRRRDERWMAAAEINRARLNRWKTTREKLANVGQDWGSDSCVVNEEAI